MFIYQPVSPLSIEKRFFAMALGVELKEMGYNPGYFPQGYFFRPVPDNFKTAAEKKEACALLTRKYDFRLSVSDPKTEIDVMFEPDNLFLINFVYALLVDSNAGNKYFNQFITLFIKDYGSVYKENFGDFSFWIDEEKVVFTPASSSDPVELLITDPGLLEKIKDLISSSSFINFINDRFIKANSPANMTATHQSHIFQQRPEPNNALFDAWSDVGAISHESVTDNGDNVTATEEPSLTSEHTVRLQPVIDALQANNKKCKYKVPEGTIKFALTDEGELTVRYKTPALKVKITLTKNSALSTQESIILNAITDQVLDFNKA